MVFTSTFLENVMRSKRFKVCKSMWTRVDHESGHYYGEFKRSADKVVVIVTLHSKDYKPKLCILKNQKTKVFVGEEDNYGLTNRDNNKIKSLVSKALGELEMDMSDLTSALETVEDDKTVSMEV